MTTLNRIDLTDAQLDALQLAIATVQCDERRSLAESREGLEILRRGGRDVTVTERNIARSERMLAAMEELRPLVYGPKRARGRKS